MLAEGGLEPEVLELLLGDATSLLTSLGYAPGAPGPVGDSSDGSPEGDAGGASDNPAAYALRAPGARGYALVPPVLFTEWLIRRLQAAQLRTLAEAVDGIEPARRRSGRGVPGDGSRPDDSTTTDPASSIPSERLLSARLAPELNLHPLTAAIEVGVAIGLVRDLPRIMNLFEQGRLDKARAALITRALHTEADERPDFGPGHPAWPLIEALIAAQAPGLTLGDLRRLIERLLLGLDPDGGEAAHARARRRRHVRVEAQPDGMALVTALVTAEAGQWLDGFLDIAADADRDRQADLGMKDERTHDQRRADVLSALVQALAEGLPIPLVPDPRNEQRDAEKGFQEAEDVGDEADGQGGEHRTDEHQNGDHQDSGHQDSGHQDSGHQDSGHQKSDAFGSQDQPIDEPNRTTSNPQDEKTQRTQQDDRRPKSPGDGAPTAPTAPGAPVPDALRRRLREDLDAETACRQESFTQYGFTPLPDGMVPALWQVPDLPRERGHGVHLVVHVTDAALLGLDNTPALLEHHGVIPAATARRLGATPAQVTLVVLPGAWAAASAETPVPAPVADDRRQPPRTTGPGNRSPREDPGCPLGQDHSQPQTRRYRPGRALTGLITTLYPECTFPGCTRQAGACDLDHLIPFSRGGFSCACNMHPACRGHHRLKTFGGWQARPSRRGEPFPPGTIVWTAPDGASFNGPPPCLPGAPGWSLPTAAPATLPRANPTNPANPATPQNPNNPADRGAAVNPHAALDKAAVADLTKPEKLYRRDLMPSTERTARRTRRWAADLAWHANRQDQLRRATAQRAARASAKRQRPVARPPHAPWGQSIGRLPGYGDPTF